MRRIGIIGLCLAVAAALGAIAASSALAGEYGECVKTAKVGKLYKGRFLNKECTAPATEAEREAGGKKNKYEWVSAAGTKYTDTTKAVLLASASGTVSCASSTSKGEITGWMTGADQVLFKGCELSGYGKKCASAGKSEGEIETFPLETYLLDHGTTGASGLEPAEGEVWTEFLAEPGNPKGKGAENSSEPLQLEYVCSPGVLFETSGTFSGVTTPVDAPAHELTEAFGEHKGEQDLKTIFYVPGETNSGPNTETMTATVKTGTTKMEIRACNESGAAPEGKGMLTCEHEESP